jgi:hypothetical protein
MALEWQLLRVPLAAGLNQKFDPRALPPPALEIAKNIEFRDIGGLQQRYPFLTIGTNILGGGTLADGRRLVENGNELLLFTKDKLYSRSVRDSAWVLKGTYQAPKLTERSVFVNPTEQITPDRAELSGVVVYTWVQTLGSTSSVYAAAMDKTTGAVLVAPTALTGGSNGTSPRLLALTNKILLFWVTDAGLSADLVAIAIDPASLSSSIGAASTAMFTQSNGFNVMYDVVKVGSTAYVAARAVHGGTGQYDMVSVSEALAVSRTTKARTCDGPIAVSAAPNGTHLQVVRANATNIQGDYLSIAGPFTDVFTGQAVGTGTGTINQIAAAHRSVQDSGQYRCYAFWSSSETTTFSSFDCKYNWVDTNNNLGTQAVFIKRLGVVSRAFDYDGKVFVWLGFAGSSGVGPALTEAGFKGQFQNTYFLYRDDQLLTAKAAMHRAGGFSQVTGRLPNVQALSSTEFAWAGTERRVIPLGKKKGYSARAPRDITLEFDSNEARRVARLGRTLYITGGQILQYDGEGLVEVGFHTFPWYLDALNVAGAIPAGSYNLKATVQWDNAQGERERSTTATVGIISLAGASKITVSLLPVHTTMKQGTRQLPAYNYWRTAVNPSAESPFYQGTSLDPANTTNPNRYLSNDPTQSFTSAFDDNLTDASLTTKETNDENGSILESLAPPAASIVAATQDRIFLAGIADNPYQVWYSKLRGENEIASFHDGLVFEVPPGGGVITGLAFLNEQLIVFCERRVYLMSGDGFANDGSGQNYGPARELANDVGAKDQESVALGPGGLWFKSNKGWYVLPGGGAPVYVGGNIVDYDSDSVQAVHVMDSKHQVRIVSTARTLIFDWVAQQWAEWTVPGTHACLWQGAHHVLNDTNAQAEQTSYSGADYFFDVETAWIYPAGPLGFCQVKWVEVLGEYRSTTDIRLRIARFQGSASVTYSTDKYWIASPTVVGAPLRFKRKPKYQRSSAFKIRLTGYASGSRVNPPADEAFRLTGLALEWAPLRGIDRRATSALSD